MLGYWDNGIRHMTNSKRPITKVEDMKGLKMRTPPDAVLVDIMQSLGAEAQQIKFAELYVALQQGVVDGQENPLVNIHASKLYEVQKHLALTSHQFQMTPFLMSKRSWDKLSDADSKAVHGGRRRSHRAAAQAVAGGRRQAAGRPQGQGRAGDHGRQGGLREGHGRRSTTSGSAAPIGPYVKKVIAAARGK